MVGQEPYTAQPVQAAQKVPFGVDPKTILCQYFKNGACTKGKNCKFSHDLNVERKADKIDLYTDTREEAKKDDTMDKWDQDKLEEVVQTKHGKNPATTTDIVCKYFIQAVEERKYGWFWNCPNDVRSDGFLDLRGGQHSRSPHRWGPAHTLPSVPDQRGASTLAHHTGGGQHTHISVRAPRGLAPVRDPLGRATVLAVQMLGVPDVLLSCSNGVLCGGFPAVANVDGSAAVSGFVA